MAKLTMYEQDIVNAICLEQARQHNILPEDIEVELAYNDDDGFSAEVDSRILKRVLHSFDIIKAIRFYIEEELKEDPYAAGIKLLLDREEGIIASIQ